MLKVPQDLRNFLLLTSRCSLEKKIQSNSCHIDYVLQQSASVSHGDKKWSISSDENALKQPWINPVQVYWFMFGQLSAMFSFPHKLNPLTSFKEGRSDST